MARAEVLPEPPEWAVIRFVLSRTIAFAALRLGNHWETTAQGDFGYGMSEFMGWPQLAKKVRKLDYATCLESVNLRDDPRVREHRAVVCFLRDGHYTAAINIDENRTWDGSWYGTNNLGGNVTWGEILQWGQQLRVVTSWVQFPPRKKRATTAGGPPRN